MDQGIPIFSPSLRQEKQSLLKICGLHKSTLCPKRPGSSLYPHRQARTQGNFGVGKSLIFLLHLVDFHMYLCNRIGEAGVCLQRSQNSNKGPRVSFSRKHGNAEGAGIAVHSSPTRFRCWGKALGRGEVAGRELLRWAPKREPRTLRSLSCLKQTGSDGHHRYP